MMFFSPYDPSLRGRVTVNLGFISNIGVIYLKTSIISFLELNLTFPLLQQMLAAHRPFQPLHLFGLDWLEKGFRRAVFFGFGWRGGAMRVDQAALSSLWFFFHFHFGETIRTSGLFVVVAAGQFLGVDPVDILVDEFAVLTY